MNRKAIWIIASFIILLSLIFASCSASTSSTTPKTPLASSTTVQSVVPPSSTSSAAPSSPPPTTSATTAHWWDKLGTPQYGGNLITKTTFVNAGSFDPTAGLAGGGGFACNGWLEELAFFNWAEDPSVWSYPSGFSPLQYRKGQLADSWEITDPQTFTVKLRQGIHWQNRPPVNGREFDSDDIAFNFDRVLGTGYGYTQPNPMMASNFTALDQVNAVDKYTVQFKFKQPGIMGVYQILCSMFGMVPPEWVALGGPPQNAPAAPAGPPGAGAAPSVSASPLADPTKVVGTGPWMLTGFVAGNSMTLSKNPDYWGTDERYPQNKLPYADTLTELAIPDPSTSLAAMRTGKIDMWTDQMGSLTWQQGKQLAGTNPQIQQFQQPHPGAVLMLRCDTKPFTDINVRQALQLAIDTQSIGKNYYGGFSNGQPVGLVNPAVTGWALPYDQWPADLQAQYTYNPTKAKQLLADAGYPNGFDTDVVASSNQDTTLLQLIQSEFKDIGVNMKINVMDPSTYSGFVAAGKQDQMVYSDGLAGMLWSPTTSLSYLISSSIPQLNSTYNRDATYDSMYNKINQALTTEDAEKASAAADQYALGQHWVVTVCSNTVPVAVQSWVKGYTGQIQVDSCWTGALRARVWMDQAEMKSMGISR